MIELQLQFEQKFARANEGLAIQNAFKKFHNARVQKLEHLAVQNVLSEKVALSVLTFLYQHKKANLTMLIGHVRFNLPESRFSCFAQFMAEAAKQGLLGYNPNGWHDKEGENSQPCWFCPTSNGHTFPKEVEQELDKYHYPFPLVVVPKEVEGATGSAYFTFSQGSIILNHDNQVLRTFSSIELALSVINNINKNAYKIDLWAVRQYLAHIKAEVGTKSCIIAKQREQQYKRQHAIELIEFVNAVKDNSIWFSWKYDTRGRMYSQGYHFNPQGDTWAKSLLKMAYSVKPDDEVIDSGDAEIEL